MHLESGILGKFGLAVGALEGPQARVRPLVQQQGALGAERLSAVGTDVLQGAAFVDLPCSRDTEDQSICVTFPGREGGAPVVGDGRRPSSF